MQLATNARLSSYASAADRKTDKPKHRHERNNPDIRLRVHRANRVKRNAISADQLDFRKPFRDIELMRRISLSLHETLADEFDQWAERHEYENRSEAFRDLLRGRLEQEQLQAGPDEGYCVATVTYVYNHHERKLASRLAESQHEHHGISLSTLHVHLDHENCLETMLLRGPLAKIRPFAESVIAQRGVRNGNIHIVPVAVHYSVVDDERHAHFHPAH
jgi:CopG family nickel-responsive transcriptional regulator